MHNSHHILKKCRATAMSIAIAGGIVFGMSAQAQDTDDIVVFRTTSGDKVYKIANVDHIAIASDFISVRDAENVTAQFNYDTFVSIRFNTVLGVSDLTADTAATIDFDGSTVRASLPLEIYDICGRKALSAPSGTADISSLTPGIYIARAGVQTLKISKK